MTEPRICYIVLESQRDDRGYIPSVVTEGEAGHSPLMGSGKFSQPWYWGSLTPGGWETAQRICAEVNAEMGLSPDDVAAITTSSIVAQFREDSARERYDDAMRRGRFDVV